MKRLFITATLFLSSLSVFAGQALLDWDDMSNNETGFSIERKDGVCTSANAFAEVGKVGVNIKTFTDTAVVEGQTYCWRVKAFNPQFVSGPSNEVFKLISFTVPANPVNLRIQ